MMRTMAEELDRSQNLCVPFTCDLVTICLPLRGTSSHSFKSRLVDLSSRVSIKEMLGICFSVLCYERETVSQGGALQSGAWPGKRLSFSHKAFWFSSRW